MTNHCPMGGITGLTLHPSSVKGRGKWVFRYVSPVTQKRRNAGLGTYPEVSIAEAARTARIMREQLAAGDDPLEIKKAESEKVAIPTFADAARRVHAELSPGWENPKHVRQWLSTLENYAFPQLGAKNAGFDYGCGRGRNTASSLVNLVRNGKPG